jgi:hypothetical protein
MLINNRETIMYEHNLETQQDAYLQDEDWEYVDGG